MSGNMVQHSRELVDICTNAAVNAATAVLCSFTSCKCFALLLPLPLLVADNDALSSVGRKLSPGTEAKALTQSQLKFW